MKCQKLNEEFLPENLLGHLFYWTLTYKTEEIFCNIVLIFFHGALYTYVVLNGSNLTDELVSAFILGQYFVKSCYIKFIYRLLTHGDLRSSILGPFLFSFSIIIGNFFQSFSLLIVFSWFTRIREKYKLGHLACLSLRMRSQKWPFHTKSTRNSYYFVLGLEIRIRFILGQI